MSNSDTIEIAKERLNKNMFSNVITKKLPERIDLSFGSGGKNTQKLIDQLIKKSLGSAESCSEDAEILNFKDSKLVFTTDSHVVSPLFFPGGDIGKLAVCGTVNDLVTRGAKPLYLSCSLIIEEGFLTSDLEKILISIGKWSKEVGAPVVTGDTKVVEKGKGDGIFINTAGIGSLISDSELTIKNICPGDQIIITGDIGDHGMALLSKREGLEFDGDIKSDCAPLNGLISSLFSTFTRNLSPHTVENFPIKAMRDPTRGGVATALNEIASSRNLGIQIHDKDIPLKSITKSACDFLGLDPLYVANEGVMLLFTDKNHSSEIIKSLKKHPLGINSKIIGSVSKSNPGKVWSVTTIGGKRLLPWQALEQLPRIC